MILNVLPISESVTYRFANDKPEYKERVKKSIRECKQVVLEKSDDNDPHAIEYVRFTTLLFLLFFLYIQNRAMAS